MKTVSNRTFVLTINDEIDAYAKSWNDMRDYCSETGKRGTVFLIKNSIPFGGSVANIQSNIEYFGEIKD